jgi:DNA-binding transcriptional regulator YdaS (Cro superfamily)
MKLTDYLKTTTQLELAKAIGVSQAMIAHWISGRHIVKAERALEIEAATRGAVTRHELRPDIWGPPPEARARVVEPEIEAVD